MKIVVLDGYTLNPGDLSWQGLEALGELTVYDRTPDDQILARIGDADIVITNKTPITRETLAKARSVRYIGVLATGYNIVDAQAARELGIVTTNIPTYGTAAVAQFTFALLLELCHHVGEHSRQVCEGAWAGAPDFCFWRYPLVELAGKALGIVGFGRIGGSVAMIARAFGMRVLAYDTNPDVAAADSCAEFMDLPELYAAADVISLHCPLFDSTRGMINRHSIARMKDGVMLINTSRGQLIVEADLAEALESGKVAGAALDVLGSEPPRADNPLIGAKNCVITPHIAWAPKESRARLMHIACENLKAFLAGKPQNAV